MKWGVPEPAFCCWGSLAGPESSRKLLFGGLKHHSFCSNPNEGRGMPGGRHSIKHRSICSNPNEGRGFPGLKHIRRARVIGETIFWGSKKHQKCDFTSKYGLCEDCDTPKSWLAIRLMFLIFWILKKSWKFAEKRKNESFLLIFFLTKAFTY